MIISMFDAGLAERGEHARRVVGALWMPAPTMLTLARPP